jgi:hypothetical protein
MVPDNEYQQPDSKRAMQIIAASCTCTASLSNSTSSWHLPSVLPPSVAYGQSKCSCPPFFVCLTHILSLETRFPCSQPSRRCTRPMHLSSVWSSYPLRSSDTVRPTRTPASAPRQIGYTLMSRNDNPDQSTTLFPRERSATFPSLGINTSGMSDDPEKAGISTNAGSRRQTQTNVASGSDGQAQQPQPHKTKSHHIRHRLLSPPEWERVARGIGGLQDVGDGHVVVHPTCWYWPPKGLPEGLYRDTVMQKTKNYYQYHVLACIRWTLMISQIILGAILTALGSLSNTNGTPITLLAALNTVDAGLLALMHNSGIPERYRNNRVEFSKVEDTFRASFSVLSPSEKILTRPTGDLGQRRCRVDPDGGRDSLRLLRQVSVCQEISQRQHAVRVCVAGVAEEEARVCLKPGTQLASNANACCRRNRRIISETQLLDQPANTACDRPPLTTTRNQ